MFYIKNDKYCSKCLKLLKEPLVESKYVFLICRRCFEKQFPSLLCYRAKYHHNPKKQHELSSSGSSNTTTTTMTTTTTTSSNSNSNGNCCINNSNDTSGPLMVEYYSYPRMVREYLNDLEVMCTVCNSPKQMKRSAFNGHLEHDCKKQCSFCNQSISKAEYKNHRINCAIKCKAADQNCSFIGSMHTIADHEKVCPYVAIYDDLVKRSKQLESLNAQIQESITLMQDMRDKLNEQTQTHTQQILDMENRERVLFKMLSKQYTICDTCNTIYDTRKSLKGDYRSCHPDYHSKDNLLISLNGVMCFECNKSARHLMEFLQSYPYCERKHEFRIVKKEDIDNFVYWDKQNQLDLV
ncbi:hypothetical protein CYY_005524 [Polysphondylium violaceum]|uniref:TRAF-type domain-containing protein n=1 Tax=Polysphondylium violaceum TaxID=133409 RepID=A0A8J4US49_9MYCE|nr:hypothetical protein CYY_005524 [Polysphondylium violaceum]